MRRGEEVKWPCDRRADWHGVLPPPVGGGRCAPTGERRVDLLLAGKAMAGAYPLWYSHTVTTKYTKYSSNA